jgi:hypothetical protein
MRTTTAGLPADTRAGAPTQLDEDLLLLTMQRTWTIAAMQGASGIDRRCLLDLARPDGPDRARLAVDALEAGGHLVPVDRERVRAGRVFRRSDAVWLPHWSPQKRLRPTAGLDTA